MAEQREVTVAVHSEDGQLWAEVLEFPGCFASGSNPKELLEALREAIGLYLTEEGASEPVAAQLDVCEDLEPVKRVPARLALA